MPGASLIIPGNLQFGKEAEPRLHPNPWLVVPGSAWYLIHTPLRHRPPRVGGQREEFRLGCTFLPCLWGGQQRNPVSTEDVGGWGGGDSRFCLPHPPGGPWEHPQPRSWARPFQGGTKAPANSCQRLKSSANKYFKNPFISLLAHKSLVSCYFKVGSRSKEADCGL